MKQALNKILIAFIYAGYLIFSKHKKGHGIHSPFVFCLIRNVFLIKHKIPEILKIEKIRKELLLSNDYIMLKGYGSSSKKNFNKKIPVKKIVKKSSVRIKYGRLLYNLAKYFNPAEIIELGTSVGISTLYMAYGADKSKIHTIEGEKELCQLAEKNFKKLQFQNINIINDNFDNVFKDLLKNSENSVMLFIDGNHSKEKTLFYFNEIKKVKEKITIAIFDDINWSIEMRNTWKIIKNDENVKLTVDIFQMGLVFFNQGMHKQNFKVKF